MEILETAKKIAEVKNRIEFLETTIDCLKNTSSKELTMLETIDSRIYIPEGVKEQVFEAVRGGLEKEKETELEYLKSVIKE